MLQVLYQTAEICSSRLAAAEMNPNLLQLVNYLQLIEYFAECYNSESVVGRYR
jgi:hypothetical protein